MSLSKKIFNISNEDEFNSIALEVFEFQYKNISVYKKYVDLVKSQKKSINHYKEIPFLPIDFFKSNHIIADNSKIEKTFLSSGTGNTTRSKHLVKDLKLYEQAFSAGYKHFYSDPKEWTILALLPSYLDQGDSSLIYMVNNFINKSENPESNYINYDLDLLKGRRKEMVREDLHRKLKKAFNVNSIHSEYGMTELLSQAYSKKNGLFKTPPWMKFIIRDFEDPYSLAKINSSGGINIIDLANIYSCSFIETQDIGKEIEKGSFEILGRFDQSEVRGCNLLSF